MEATLLQMATACVPEDHVRKAFVDVQVAAAQRAFFGS